MTRVLTAAVLLALGAAGATASVGVADDVGPPPPETVTVVQTVTVDRLAQGKPVRWWESRAIHNRRQVNRLKRTLLSRPSVVEALRLSSVVYGVPYRLLYWKASCESTGGHGLNPRAKNPRSTASGLGQFLDSTWASTPFARFSPFSVFAAALAMGWMHDAGRAGEWAASRHCWEPRA